MNIMKTLTINGTTYEITPIVPASSVTLLANRWVRDGDSHSQVVEVAGITPRSKVDLQPTREQLEEFHHQILAFTTKNDNGVVTAYAIGDKPSGDHTIQITLTEVEGTGPVRGNTVGTTMPRSNFNQTDSTKADYIVGRENILSKNELPSATEEALRQAKESGEFDGPPGKDGKSAYDYAKEAGYTGTEAEFSEKLAADFPAVPEALPNPHALTINGVSYDGSEAVNLEITGGSGGGSSGESSLLGQTPYTLNKAESVRLVSEGDCTYNIKGVTVADLSTVSVANNNAKVTEHEDYTEITATGGNAWYESYATLTVSGLTVGTKYVLAVRGLGIDEANGIGATTFTIKNSNGTQLGTVDAENTSLNSVEFTADTSNITIIWYTVWNYYWTRNCRTARISDLYINEASDGTTRTEVINQSGSFTDTYVLGKLSAGVTITADPSCYVYKISGGESGGGSLPLEGKTVVCFGDSLFGMYTGDGSAPAYVAKRTGATVHNVGFGGCRMSVHPTTGYAEFCMWALAKAIAEGDWSAQDAAASKGYVNFSEQLAVLKEIDFNEVDYIVIHYGTNDFNGAPIDNANNKTDYTTLCGALRYSVEKLLSSYPKLRIFLSLPAFRYWTADDGSVTYSDTYQNGNGHTLVDFVEALRKTAEEYNLPVIDSYYGLGINKVNASTFLSDGVHHNIDGRKRFGEFIGASIIAENTGRAGGSSEGGGSTNSGGSASIDVSASVGQTIVVKEVDANGQPTKWEAADYQPRTHWSEMVEVLPETEFVCVEDSPYFVAESELTFEVGAAYTVTYNGVQYNCIGFSMSGQSGIGNYELLMGAGDSGEPFVIATDGSELMCVPFDGSESVMIAISRQSFTPIPPNYLSNAYPYYIEVTATANKDGTNTYSINETSAQLANLYASGRSLVVRVTEVYESSIEYVIYNLKAIQVNAVGTIYAFISPTQYASIESLTLYIGAYADGSIIVSDKMDDM